MTLKKNILLVSSKYMPEYSGSGFRAHNLYKRLCSKNPELSLTVLCGSVTENECLDYEHDGFKVHRVACKPCIGTKSGYWGQKWCEIRNFSAENGKTAEFLTRLGEKPDLIHIFGRNFVTASAAIYARENNIPLITELCNEMDYPFQYVPFPNNLWIDCSLPERSLFVCISQQLKKVCLQSGIKDELIWCRPNPVDENKFKPVDEARKHFLRSKLTGFGTDKKLIVYIAQFRKSKNHIFLLDVLKNLPEDFVLYMKGPLVENGPLLDEDRSAFNSLKTKIDEYCLQNRVMLEAGFCENIEEYYQMADVYAFPSMSEGLGTPVLEAIACGVPVVSNKIPDVTDVWIKDGENGYVSVLETNTFAKNMQNSLSIMSDVLRLNSKQILEKASSSVIDGKYLDVIGGKLKQKILRAMDNK